jgi:pyruvate dehydrogenase E1 component alpha subunit
MNLAVVRGLPIVFLCEDNEYSISVSREVSTAGELHRRGEAFGIPGWRCDGTDVEEVDRAFVAAFEVARVERRPALVTASVYRFRGHYEGDLDLYRAAAEKEAALQTRDPVALLRERLDANPVGRTEIDAAEAAAGHAVQEWMGEARRVPKPLLGSAREGVFVGG